MAVVAFCLGGPVGSKLASRPPKMAQVCKFENVGGGHFVIETSAITKWCTFPKLVPNWLQDSPRWPKHFAMSLVWSDFENLYPKLAPNLLPCLPRWPQACFLDQKEALLQVSLSRMPPPLCTFRGAVGPPQGGHRPSSGGP